LSSTPSWLLSSDAWNDFLMLALMVSAFALSLESMAALLALLNQLATSTVIVRLVCLRPP